MPRSSQSTFVPPVNGKRAMSVPSSRIAKSSNGLPESFSPQYTPGWRRLAVIPDSSGSSAGARPTRTALLLYRRHAGGMSAAAANDPDSNIAAATAAQPSRIRCDVSGCDAETGTVAERLDELEGALVAGRVNAPA